LSLSKWRTEKPGLPKLALGRSLRIDRIAFSECESQNYCPTAERGDGKMNQTGKREARRLTLGAARNAVVTPDLDEDVLTDDDIGTRIGDPWKVVLYNDDIHTFDEVISQLQKALACGVQRAENIAFEAHTKGKAIAFSGEFNECFRVMGVLREIQLIVEIEG
jgi:ATP-dependent Clp protease adapter protein ClpS